jgi:hypothetical protein
VAEVRQLVEQLLTRVVAATLAGVAFVYFLSRASE